MASVLQKPEAKDDGDAIENNGKTEYSETY